MPSHWSDIGLPLTSQDVYKRYSSQALNAGERFDIKRDAYVRWAFGGGAELWLQLYQKNGSDYVGLNPHFAGETSIPLTLTHRIVHAEYSPLDGGFQGYACVQFRKKVEHIRLVFDVPNHKVYEKEKLPSRAVVQLAAFTRSLTVYSSESEYFAKSKGKRKLSPASLFPSGIVESNLSGVQPQACASLGGYVLQAKRMANPTTRKKFYWARLRTLIGELDLVADPKYIERPLVEGNVVWGEFYLSGLLLEVGKRGRNKVSAKW